MGLCLSIGRLDSMIRQEQTILERIERLGRVSKKIQTFFKNDSSLAETVSACSSSATRAADQYQTLVEEFTRQPETLSIDDLSAAFERTGVSLLMMSPKIWAN